jgi:1,4-alpha-glucan branching enzyme
MKSLFKFHFLISFIFITNLGCNKFQKKEEPTFLKENVTFQSPLPDWVKSAGIYEVNIRQYSREGTIRAFSASLPRLQKMGVKILWFMPVFAISTERKKGTLGSYYAVSDYFKINPAFGTEEDFLNTINQAHQLGMKVILDWVPNHTGWSHIWIKNHPEFYTQDAKGNITDPLDPKTGKSFGWTDVADLNYDNKSMRHEMKKALTYWVKKADIDGYRFDVAGEVPIDFWQECLPELLKVKGDLFFLAEGDKPELRNSGLFHATYGWKLHHLFKDIVKGIKNGNDLLNWWKEDRETFKKGFAMNFTTNHDENSWQGTTKNFFGDAERTIDILTFTFDGMPLIYSGMENNLNKQLAFFEKDEIDFGNYPKELFYRTLLVRKKQNQALWNGADGGESLIVPTNDNDKYFAFTREKKVGNETHRILVVSNLTNEVARVNLLGNRFAGFYIDAFNDEPFNILPDQIFDLKPWETIFLSNK